MVSAMDMSGLKVNIEEFLKKAGLDRPDIYLHGLEDCEPAALINAVEQVTRVAQRASAKINDQVFRQDWAKDDAASLAEYEKQMEEGNKWVDIILDVASDRCSCRASRD